jgi:hypothetical protein
VKKCVWIAALAAAAAVAAIAGPAVANQPHVICPLRSQVAQLPRWRPGGRLHADVDGDGRPDTVTIRLARWADGRCAFYLRVATAKRMYTLSLGRWLGDLGKLQYNAPIRDWQFRVPVVEAIVDLGGRDNLVALADNEGAANTFVRLVALDHGRFRSLQGAVELSTGGSVMDETGLACSRGGLLRALFVDNAATREHPNRWSFSSVTYRRQGWRFVAVARRTLYGSNAQMAAAGKRAGLSGEPLKGCSITRDPRFKD